MRCMFLCLLFKMNNVVILGGGGGGGGGGVYIIKV